MTNSTTMTASMKTLTASTAIAASAKTLADGAERETRWAEVVKPYTPEDRKRIVLKVIEIAVLATFKNHFDS